MYFIEICEALTLDNGMIDCQYGDNGGPNAGDMCSFTCDAGFDLSGSASRTCFENGTWSGEISMCTGSKLFCVTFIIMWYEKICSSIFVLHM